MGSSTRCCMESGVPSRRRRQQQHLLRLPRTVVFVAMAGFLVLLSSVPCSCRRDFPSSSNRRLTLKLRSSRHSVDELLRPQRRQLGLFDASPGTPANGTGSGPPSAPGTGSGPGSGPGGFAGPAVGSSVTGLVTLRDLSRSPFTVDVMMGTPPQQRSLVVGFTDYLSWTFCTGALPAKSVSPPFDPSSSTSFASSSCSSATCLTLQTTSEAACATATCTVARYNDATQTDGLAGELVSDIVQFKGVPSSRFTFDGMACITNMQGKYINFSADGVLGLAQSKGGFFASITDQLQLPKILSLCYNSTGYMQRSSSAFAGAATLLDDGGSVVVGEPPAWITYPGGVVASTTSLVALEPSAELPAAVYAAAMESMTVGSSLSSATIYPPNPPLVFFGNTGFLTFVPLSNLTLIARAIQLATNLVATPVTPLTGGITMVLFSSTVCSVDSFPDITLTLKGGATLTATPADYTLLAEEPTGGCSIILGFASHRTDAVINLGMSMLQSKWLTFDMSGLAASHVLKIGTGPCSADIGL